MLRRLREKLRKRWKDFLRKERKEINDRKERVPTASTYKKNYN